MSTRPHNHQPRNFHWVLDWDGTITEKDTLDALVHIAASHPSQHPQKGSWKEVVDAYINDYTTALKTLVPDGNLPSTLAEERDLLIALKPVETRSLERVHLSRIFTWITQDIIYKGAQEALNTGRVVFRPGISNFLERFPDSQILSVNWSRHFIHACLGIPKSRILSNELHGITKNHVSNGAIGDFPHDPWIVSSDDKMRHLDKIKASTSLPVAYVGDSWTDIECLLAVDLGICIRNEPMTSSQNKLADSLERLGFTCPRLREVTELKTRQVAWATNFDEILAWIDDHHTQSGK